MKYLRLNVNVEGDSTTCYYGYLIFDFGLRRVGQLDRYIGRCSSRVSLVSKRPE